MIKFSAPLVGAVGYAVSREETRYYLKGIYFHANTLACATDGHMLTLARDPHAVIDDPGIIPISDPALRACRKKYAGDLIIADGFLTVTDNEGRELHSERAPAPINGTFPDFRRVIPSPTDGFGPTDDGFGCIVTRAIIDTAKVIGAQGFAIRRAMPDGAEGPHLVRYDCDRDIFSIAMPFRTPATPTGKPSTLPDWYAETAPAPAVAEAAE